MFKSALVPILCLTAWMGAARAAAPVAVTVPAAPTALAPASTDAQTLQPHLAWSQTSATDGYQVQISTAKNFATLAVNDSNVQVTSKQETVTQYATLYYWRVRGHNVSGDGAYSAVDSFTTLPAKPGVPAAISPADKATFVPILPKLMWHKPAGAVSYQLQILTAAAAPAVVVDTQFADTVYDAVKPLAYNSGYTWHVRALNAGGQSDYDAARAFTTVPMPPPVPVLIAPADKAAQVNLPVTLAWHKADRAVTYRLQASLKKDFATLALDTLLGADTTFVAKALAYDTVYYWHVRAGNQGGRSNYADSLTFSTLQPPPTAVLASPADAATDLDVSPRLVWHKAERATKYAVMVSLKADFSTHVSLDTVADTSKVVGPLANKTVYYWQVQALNAAGGRGFSAHRSFTTVVLMPPAAPLLAAPLDGATALSQRPSLKWHPAARATGYFVQVSLTPTFAAVADTEVSPDTIQQTGILAVNTLYYWRVLAKNAAGSSAYSEIRSFTTTAGKLSDPVLVSPSDAATGLPRSVTLKWSAAMFASAYHLQVSDQADFSNLLTNDSSLTDTSKQVGPLAAGATYYWRVQAKNATGVSHWSDSRAFTVVVAAPGVPALGDPADGLDSVGEEVTLIWHPVVGAAGYRVQVSTSATFASPMLDDSSLTDTTRHLSGLAANTHFYWRVLAMNAGGSGAFSEIRSFHTQPATGTKIPGGLSPRFAAGAAGRGFKADFTLAQAAHARLTLINPFNGRQEILMDKGLEAGSYHVESGAGHASGLYLMRLEAGNLRETRKVFLP